MDLENKIQNAIEWANKWLTLQGQGLSQEQKNYLTFALSQNFADNSQNLQLIQPDVIKSVCSIGAEEHNKSIFNLGQCHNCYKTKTIE